MMRIEIQKVDPLRHVLILSMFFVGITLVLDSCIPSSKPVFDVSGLEIEKKSNGYLICFTANRRINTTEAFVTRSNWLVITIANASVDLNKLKSTKPQGIIRKIEVEKFESSVQVSMELSEKEARVEVVHNPKTNDILVDLFTTPKN